MRNGNIGLILLIGCNLLLSCHSRTAGVRTEAPDGAVWTASSWISAPDAQAASQALAEKGVLAADGASCFSAVKTNPQKVVSARWTVTSLGVFQIRLNGRPVGEEFLRPGFTHPRKTRRSFTYDLTDDFKKGKGAENRLDAQVTPGWWADKIATPRHGEAGRKCAFRAVLELVYSDGSRELSGTDCTNWKAAVAGGVQHAGIYDGERFDARETPFYRCDTRGWGLPEENTEFPGEILPSEGAEVFLREDLAMAPVSSWVWKEVADSSESAFGHVLKERQFEGDAFVELEAGENWVVDFGQNASAVPSFLFSAAAGTVLSCLPAEMLNDGNGARSRGMDGPEGSIHRTNLRSLAQDGARIDYTFSGKGKEAYTPSCSFFGYRYMNVTATAPVRIYRVRSIPVTSISRSLESGTLKTGSQDIDKLISNTVWGQRSNYLSVPTDCPQRDERLGWLADTQVFAETGSFFADTRAFFHKWMRDLRDSQLDYGGFPGVAPPGPYGGPVMRLGWADAGVIVPWTVWKQYGDKAIVEENWDAMCRYMAVLNETRFDHEVTKQYNKNYQWADWLSYEPLETHSRAAFRPGTKEPLPETNEYWSYLGGCYWAIDASMMRDMAAATGKDSEVWEQMRREAVQYLRDRFLEKDGTFKLQILNTMQTPALFALKLGLTEGEAHEQMLERLKENFRAHGGCLQTGFLGTSILMDVLTENGLSDVAYDLLFQHKNPSWLYSVDNGATTIWERWNSYTLENGMGPKGMNSFNHYAYGCVCAWIWKTAAGIASDPAEPGFRHIIMKPVPDRRLGSVEAVYQSAAGEIRSEWHYDGDRWIWRFTVPEGCSAAVTLPGESQSREYGSGSYELERNL